MVWGLQHAFGNPHDCCALHLVIYFGSIWTAANKRLRSLTVKASAGPFSSKQLGLRAAQLKINERASIWTRSRGFICEIQNCFDSTTKRSIAKTIILIKRSAFLQSTAKLFPQFSLLLCSKPTSVTANCCWHGGDQQLCTRQHA